MVSDSEHTAAETHEDGHAVDNMVEQAQQVGSAPTAKSGGLDLLMGVSLSVTVELGRTRMKISEILNLGSGSVIELQKLASEPVDVLVNDALFARGEVAVVEDHFAIKITELVDGADLGQLTGGHE